jgi:gas vesicle protein
MKNSVSGIITAFLAGAAVGALFGILYAPDKGSATRAKLRTLGDELGDDISEGIEELKREFSGEKEAEPKKKAPGKRGRKPRGEGKK